MNNEPNTPTELTEKELEGIAGGGDCIEPMEGRTGIKTVEAELVEGGERPICGCSPAEKCKGLVIEHH